MKKFLIALAIVLATMFAAQAETSASCISTSNGGQQTYAHKWC